jgi:Transposase DDE domain.
VRLKDKIAKLKEEVARLNAINAEMMKSEDKQISLTDPDARSMATSGKDTGIVGYNVQTAVDTKNHLIVAHEVTNVGTDRRQLSNIAEQARTEMGVETLDAVADRGYYAGEEIRACEEAGITVTLPKPMTSNAKAAGRFGKQDFRYVAAEDAYVCPAGQRLAYSFTTEDKGLLLRRYRTNACQSCAIRHSCTTREGTTDLPMGARGRARNCAGTLDQHPEKMTIRRQTAEHPFGTIKCWMGATHFLTKRLPKVATEMALNVLAYNIKRVMAIIGVAGLLEALAA